MNFNVSQGDSRTVARLKLIYLLPIDLIGLPLLFLVLGFGQLADMYRVWRAAWKHTPEPKQQPLVWPRIDWL